MKLSFKRPKRPDIPQLIDLFMAGETTLAQERELFEAFAPGRSVAPDLEQYRPMMQWYASMQSAEPEADSPTVGRKVPRVALWLSSAAALAMLLTVGVGYMARISQLPDDYALYRGSYVIRNGQKVTDLAQILPEVKRVEQIVSGQQAAVARAVASTPPDAADIYDLIDMDDPVVRSVMERVMSE